MALSSIRQAGAWRFNGESRLIWSMREGTWPYCVRFPLPFKSFSYESGTLHIFTPGSQLENKPLIHHQGNPTPQIPVRRGDDVLTVNHGEGYCRTGANRPLTRCMRRVISAS